jgi:hypothetical protein
VVVDSVGMMPNGHRKDETCLIRVKLKPFVEFAVLDAPAIDLP